MDNMLRTQTQLAARYMKLLSVSTLGLQMLLLGGPITSLHDGLPAHLTEERSPAWSATQSPTDILSCTTSSHCDLPQYRQEVGPILPAAEVQRFSQSRSEAMNPNTALPKWPLNIAAEVPGPSYTRPGPTTDHARLGYDHRLWLLNSAQELLRYPALDPQNYSASASQVSEEAWPLQNDVAHVPTDHLSIESESQGVKSNALLQDLENFLMNETMLPDSVTTSVEKDPAILYFSDPTAPPVFCAIPDSKNLEPPQKIQKVQDAAKLSSAQQIEPVRRISSFPTTNSWQDHYAPFSLAAGQGTHNISEESIFLPQVDMGRALGAGLEKTNSPRKSFVEGNFEERSPMKLASSDSFELSSYGKVEDLAEINHGNMKNPNWKSITGKGKASKGNEDVLEDWKKYGRYEDRSFGQGKNKIYTGGLSKEGDLLINMNNSSYTLSEYIKLKVNNQKEKFESSNPPGKSYMKPPPEMVSSLIKQITERIPIGNQNKNNEFSTSESEISKHFIHFQFPEANAESIAQITGTRSNLDNGNESMIQSKVEEFLKALLSSYKYSSTPIKDNAQKYFDNLPASLCHESGLNENGLLSRRPYVVIHHEKQQLNSNEVKLGIKLFLKNLLSFNRNILWYFDYSINDIDFHKGQQEVLYWVYKEILEPERSLPVYGYVKDDIDIKNPRFGQIQCRILEYLEAQESWKPERVEARRKVYYISKRDMSAARLAIHILGAYYFSQNPARWARTFQSEKQFLKLMDKMAKCFASNNFTMKRGHLGSKTSERLLPWKQK